MLDYLRNLTKSEEEKREEMLSAYLDGALTPREQRQVEQELAQDNVLARRLENMRLLRQQMRQLPLRHVRRNFTLDPALYGRPKREPLVQAYPVLRTATALAAFLFVFLVAANLFFAGTGTMAPAAEPAAELAAEAPPTEAEATPMERVVTEVTEVVVEEESESAALMMEEEAMDEAAEAEEAPAVETAEVEPSFDLPAEEAPLRQEATAVFEESDFDAAQAVPQEGAERLERPEALASPPGEEISAAPTVAAEAVEVQPAPPPREPAVSGQGPEQAEGTAAETLFAPQGFSLMTWLWVVSILVGLSLIVLVVLTLLARRRL